MALTVNRQKLQIKEPPAPVVEASVETAPVVEFVRANWTPYAVVGIIAMLVMVALLVLQYLEWDYYKNGPERNAFLTPEELAANFATLPPGFTAEGEAAKPAEPADGIAPAGPSAPAEEVAPAEPAEPAAAVAPGEAEEEPAPAEAAEPEEEPAPMAEDAEPLPEE